MPTIRSHAMLEVTDWVTAWGADRKTMLLHQILLDLHSHAALSVRSDLHSVQSANLCLLVCKLRQRCFFIFGLLLLKLLVFLGFLLV